MKWYESEHNSCSCKKKVEMKKTNLMEMVIKTEKFQLKINKRRGMQN